MGFWSSVGSFIGGCCSAIGSICSGIGGAVMGAIGALAVAIAPILPIVALAVQAIGILANILKPDEKPEDFGQAAEQMEKKPEDFDSINEYIDYLREGIRSGKVELNKDLSDEKLVAYKAVGCGLTIKGIEEKYGLKTSAEFWGMAGNMMQNNKLNADELGKILELSKSNDVSPENISNYIKGEKMEGGQKASSVSDVIENGLKDANPKMSEEEITARFNNLLKV